MIWRWSRWSRR